MMKKIVEFTKPDKWKILLALLLPLIWVVISALSGKLSSIISPMAVPVYPIGITALVYLLAYALYSILFYPFSCAIATLISYCRNKEIKSLLKDKSLLTLVFMGILVFNPVSILIIERLLFFTTTTISSPYLQGVQVIEIDPASPVANFGSLKEGVMIFEIEGVRISDTPQALAILNKTKPGDLIGLRYKGGYTEYYLEAHENMGRGYLGIKIKDRNGIEAVL